MEPSPLHSRPKCIPCPYPFTRKEVFSMADSNSHNQEKWVIFQAWVHTILKEGKCLHVFRNLDEICLFCGILEKYISYYMSVDRKRTEKKSTYTRIKTFFVKKKYTFQQYISAKRSRSYVPMNILSYSVVVNVSADSLAQILESVPTCSYIYHMDRHLKKCYDTINLSIHFIWLNYFEFVGIQIWTTNHCWQKASCTTDEWTRCSIFPHI